MNSPHGGQPWPNDPFQPSSGDRRQPPPPPGAYPPPPPADDRTAVMPAYPPPPDAGATAVLPPYASAPRPSGGFPEYGGAPPPPEPPKSRTGLIVGLVVGGVVLLLALAGGILAAVYVNRDDTVTAASASPTTSSTPTGDATPSSDPSTPEASEAPTRKVTHKAPGDACDPVAKPIVANGYSVTTTFGSSKSKDEFGTSMFCSVGINDSDTVVVSGAYYEKTHLGRSPDGNARTFYDIGRKQDGTAGAGATVREVSGVGERAYVQLPNDSRPIKVVAVHDNLVIQVKVDSSDRYSKEDAIKMASDIAKAYIDET